MPENEQPFEDREHKEQTPRPSLLDVVKIDGRWAQVIWDGNYIKYLDDGSQAPINWDDFHYTRNWEKMPVWEVKKLTSFTQVELSGIHWGPEQKQHPELREEVTVFGEFERKQEMRNSEK